MRIRVDVEPDRPSLRWEEVHGPARAVMYELLGSHDAAMAQSLHDEGWRGKPLKPLGMTSPQFKGAPRKSGVYTTSNDGSVWLGSPIPEIAAALGRRWRPGLRSVGCGASEGTWLQRRCWR